MNKKGFTLIELLAVIIILAILTLIVSPIVSGVISSSKVAADQRSAEAYIKAAENYFASTIIDQDKQAKIGTNIIDELEVSNHKATGSVIVNENGDVSIDIVINGHCFKKDYMQSLSEMVVDANCSGEPSSGGSSGSGGLPPVQSVDNLKITEVRTPKLSTYANSVTVSILNEQTQDVEIYVMTTVTSRIATGAVVSSCNSSFSQCVDFSDSNLEANTWYKTSGADLIKLVLTQEGTVYTRVTNGSETKEQNIAITNVDSTSPTAPVISVTNTYGTSPTWAAAVTLNIDTPSSAPSGIEKYQFCNTTTNDSSSCSGWYNLGSAPYDIPDGEYYLFVRGVSNSGMEGVPSNSVAIKKEDPDNVGGVTFWEEYVEEGTLSCNERKFSISDFGTAPSGVAEARWYLDEIPYGSERNVPSYSSWYLVDDDDTFIINVTEDPEMYREVHVAFITNAGNLSYEGVYPEDYYQDTMPSSCPPWGAP